MKNKIFIFLSFISFPSFISALTYEVRGVERVSNMFGDGICVSLYITNNTRNTYSFNIFAIDAKGDGLTSSPSFFISKKPDFTATQDLAANSKARGWLCFDEPEYGWVPETIEFSEVFGSKFLTVYVN
tara:strand:+ start:105 stop:488 length:384 start_codon:yes stop_codon:yes gene_type:complete